jgi:IclR family acetate operon transcriptional repressor
MQSKSNVTIQSLNRGLEIIELITESKTPVTLNEIADKLGVNKSTAFRLANTLFSKGFIAYAEGSKTFILGSRIWSMGYQYNWYDYLVSFSNSVMDNLVLKTQETVHLAVRSGQYANFMAHRLTNQALLVSGRTGESVPLYCTAHGKALLADFNIEQLRELFSGFRFKKYTEHTITDKIKLAAECKLIKSRGYALDEFEIYEDIKCIAAPIRNAQGNLIASVGISAPVARLYTEEIVNKNVDLVVSAAKSIENRLHQNHSNIKTESNGH